MDNSRCDIRNLDEVLIITTKTGREVEARIDIWKDTPHIQGVRLLPQHPKPYQGTRRIKLNHEEAVALASALNSYLDWHRDSLAGKTPAIGG